MLHVDLVYVERNNELIDRINQEHHGLRNIDSPVISGQKLTCPFCTKERFDIIPYMGRLGGGLWGRLKNRVYRFYCVCTYCGYMQSFSQDFSY